MTNRRRILLPFNRQSAMHRILIVGLLLLGACAMGGTGTRTGARDVITRTQLDENPGSTAHEVIERLRPQWLRLREERSLSGGNDLVVYLNNARMGGRNSLRGIPVAGVEYIRYYGPTAANLRWGTGHAYGVIFISTVPEME